MKVFLKASFVGIVRIFFFATVTGAFFGWPWCWLAVKTQGLLWGLVLTLLLGRFFCRSACPLGMLQSVVSRLRRPRTAVRRVCTRLPETKAQRIVRWSVFSVCVILAACGYMGIVTMLVPISIYGKAVTLWAPGLVVFLLVLTLAAVGDGRVWCNWICPFGTLFNLVAKISLRKDKVGVGCARCGRCFKAKSVAPAAATAGVTRRETLRGVAVLAVTEKLADGGFADVSLPGVPERERSVLPPGAVDRRTFSLKCAACQLCVANCPGGCLRPSTRLATFGQPEMDFRRGYCLANCVKCIEICPERALDPFQREQRPNLHLGRAVWQQDRCVRTTNGDACTACVRKCPVQAIHLVKGFPVVDGEKCLGCGACEHVCPARPLPAIYVKGYEMQKAVNPISEADLLAEMRTRLAAGASVVVARGGVIVAEETGRGIGPLLRVLDARRLKDAVVFDKVIGRAAAAICAVGGAKKVYALLAGNGAAELLATQGVPLKADQTVEVILNHERTGSCPMEQAVDGLNNLEKMVEVIRKVKVK